VTLPSSDRSDRQRPTASSTNIEHLATRIRAEFQEMPGLRITLSQAQRLWGLAPDVCSQVVEVLVTRSVLKRRGDTLSLAD
jgi:hypothetical protein